MRLLLVAPPGAGKGTQAARMAARYGITHLSSGALLRAQVEAGTALGRSVAETLARGDLVPDAVVLAVLGLPVVEAGLGTGYVLDGFPRTVAQAEVARALAEPAGLHVQLVLSLDVPPDELVRRVAARRTGDRGRRGDDTDGVLRHRLAVYDRDTAPLLAAYEAHGLLRRIDGLGSVEEVGARVDEALASLAAAR